MKEFNNCDNCEDTKCFFNKKEKKTVVLSFRLTEKNRDFLGMLKDITGTSQNALINQMLEEYRKEYKELKGEK